MSLSGAITQRSAFAATASPGGEACAADRITTTCTISGLADGTTYSIAVVAHTTAGDSGASIPATVEPSGEPTGPIVSTDHTGACVDDNGGSSRNDTLVVMWDCNGSFEQAWTVESDGTIQFDGKCLDIYRDERTDKAPVELWTCTGGANQQWQASNGMLVNPVSGKCLDDPAFVTTDGTPLDIYTCNGGANQLWNIP